MDRLKNKSDSIEAMKFPEPEPQDNVELIDNKKLKKIKPQQEAKKIRVTGTKVSLHRGPGPKYLKIGNAVKGDEFELVRVERGFDNGRTWYLVRDSLGNKFFIAKSLTSIVEKKPSPIPVSYTHLTLPTIYSV